MALSPGTHLGPYEIQAAIGAGGMGEVYKARDTRLDRSVAIKVLPPAFSTDADRRARFEREAKTIAGLTHPHICTLHDVGEHEGSTFLVMEHLTGETLAQRLQKGPLPLERALTLATEIADALSAAHRQGVIHRDLKPGNLMLTKAGAKLLDFGLAKLKGYGEQPAAAHLASAPTQSTPLTGEGMIVGTLQYMAPEQLEGKPADARTDLWALGAILYEMITGKRAFEGASAASLITAIMGAEPTPIVDRQPLAPAQLDHVVRTCLAKDPEERWQSAADLKRELAWLAHQPSMAGPGPTTRGQSARRTILNGIAVATAAVVLVVLTALATGLVFWKLRPAGSPSPVVRSLLAVSPADELNAGGYVSWQPTPGGSRTALAFTPDGRALIFVGRKGGVQQLYVRERDRSDARPLAGTEGAQVPVVSPDGAWVAFWSGGAIRKVALGGGPAVVISDGIRYPPAGMTWGTTGRLVFSQAITPDWALWGIPSTGGAPVALTKRLPGEEKHILPHLLPGDVAVLFNVRKYVWIWSQDEVDAQIQATGERRVLLRDAADARYVPSGHLVFLRRGVLMAVPFDLDRLQVRGDPVPLFDRVAHALTGGNSNDVTGAGQFSVAANGTLAYVSGSLQPFREGNLTVVDRRGTLHAVPAPTRSYFPVVRVSPEGSRLAICIHTLEEVSLWVFDLRRRTLSKLTSGGEAQAPAWTPDGQKIAFRWVRGDAAPGLWWQRADGSSPPERLSGEGAVSASSWSPDGRELLLERNARDVWTVSPGAGDATLRPLVETPGRELSPVFAPDGRAVAYESDASGRVEVCLQPYPGPGPTSQVSVDGGRNAAWNPRGNELFFVRPAVPAHNEPARMMVVDVRTGPPLDAGLPKVLFDTAAGSRWVCEPTRCYDLAPDGQQFYIVTDAPSPPRNR